MVASAYTVPAIMAADGHFRAVSRSSEERTVKTKKTKKGLSRIGYTYTVVILWKVNLLAQATEIKRLLLHFTKEW